MEKHGLQIGLFDFDSGDGDSCPGGSRGEDRGRRLPDSSTSSETPLSSSPASSHLRGSESASEPRGADPGAGDADPVLLPDQVDQFASGSFGDDLCPESMIPTRSQSRSASSM